MWIKYNTWWKKKYVSTTIHNEKIAFFFFFRWETKELQGFNSMQLVFYGLDKSFYAKWCFLSFSVLKEKKFVFLCQTRNLCFKSHLFFLFSILFLEFEKNNCFSSRYTFFFFFFFFLKNSQLLIFCVYFILFFQDSFKNNNPNIFCVFFLFCFFKTEISKCNLLLFWAFA